MDTIQLNGKTYVEESELEKSYIKKDLLEAEYIHKSKIEKPSFDNFSVNLTDEATVMGLGSVELLGDWRCVKVSTTYLERALKALSYMTSNNKRETIVIAISKDKPLCLGDIKGNKFSGVLIAPRVETE